MTQTLYRLPAPRLMLLSTTLLVSCGEGDPPPSGQTVAPYIKGGTLAQDYPASCLVDIYDAQNRLVALCSGAVIAPSVVLTAGHCTSGFSHFQVTCPYLHQQSSGSGITHPDYHVGPSGSVASDSDDIGLVVLDQRILMDQYPVVRSTRAPDGTSVVNIGRVLDGAPSRTDLYRSAAIQIKDGRTINFPHDYVSVDEIQPGDSGGPTYRVGSSPLELVAVNSGAGTDFAIFGRPDVVYPWFAAQVANAGGFGLPPGYPALHLPPLDITSR